MTAARLTLLMVVIAIALVAAMLAPVGSLMLEGMTHVLG